MTSLCIIPNLESLGHRAKPVGDKDKHKLLLWVYCRRDTVGNLVIDPVQRSDYSGRVEYCLEQVNLSSSKIIAIMQSLSRQIENCFLNNAKDFFTTQLDRIKYFYFKYKCFYLNLGWTQ